MGYADYSESEHSCITCRACAADRPVSSESIVVDKSYPDNALIFERAGRPRVAIYVGKNAIRIGCHRISVEAWKRLKGIVDGQL